MKERQWKLEKSERREKKKEIVLVRNLNKKERENWQVKDGQSEKVKKKKKDK